LSNLSSNEPIAVALDFVDPTSPLGRLIADDTVVVDQSKMMLIYAPADQPLEVAYLIVFQEKEQPLREQEEQE
jgi:hypothetical protein